MHNQNLKQQIAKMMANHIIQVSNQLQQGLKEFQKKHKQIQKQLNQNSKTKGFIL
ncbi:hypothetical protein [Persephonella sp.]